MSQMELKLSTPDRRILKNLTSAVEKLAAELARSRPQQAPTRLSEPSKANPSACSGCLNDNYPCCAC